MVQYPGHARRRRLRRAAALACVLAAVAAASPAAEPFSGELDVTLDGAMVEDPDRADSAGDLFLHLEASEGRWKRVWGKGYGISEHPGLVSSAEVTDRQIRLKLTMRILGDFWIKGEWPAYFDLRIDRGSGGDVTGRYEGTFQGNACSGKVTGKLLPPRPVDEGFARPRPDEHPRLLFRTSDLPALREKLRTPFGQAYRRQAEKSGDMINLGVLYQLTGDRSYAAKARQAVRSACQDEEGGRIPVYGFGSGGFGHHVFRAAVAFDLCQDAWPEAFNDWLRQQLEEFTERQQHVLMTSHANYHPCSNYYGPGRGVPGVVSMILWGRKGPPPEKPKHPVERAWRVDPPKSFEPGKGVPTVDLQPGQAPAKWIWTGLLRYECSRDVLHTIGGYERARPQVGTRARYAVRSEDWFRITTLAFEPLPDPAATKEGIDLAKLSDSGDGSVSVYYTSLRVKEEQIVRPALRRKGVRTWLSGVELKREKFYRVQPGLHPLTVELRTKKTEGVLAPTLLPVDPEAREGPLALYQVRRALWKRKHERWQGTGIDPRRQLWLERGWFQNFQHYRWGIGNGGFQAETGAYAQIGSWYPSVYASMYENFFGRAVSSYPDVGHLIPRYIMQHVYPPGGKPVYQKLNSVATLNRQWMACHFPIIPGKYKPSALWVWNYLSADRERDSSDVSSVLAGARGIWGLSGLTLAQAFVNYPVDLPGRPAKIEPVHPRRGMPRTWRAETFGFHVFRSGWQGGEEFVSQVFAKAAPVVGWNHPNAGSFVIRGLGRTWSTAPTSRNGVRPQYSVVLLPEDEINRGSCGRVVHYQGEPDGSGTLTIDMDDVYAAPSKGLYDGRLVRHPERRRDSGLHGLRAFGFDYSGRCGSPALVVIVDKITGGGKKLWTWQRPEGDVEIDGNTFTLRRGDAGMRATFITPEDVKIEAPGPENIQVGDPRHGFHGTVNRVKATGGDNYFVILTFQKGEPPAVEVDGSGLDAAVRVGPPTASSRSGGSEPAKPPARRTVRFDGKRVIFE